MDISHVIYSSVELANPKPSKPGLRVAYEVGEMERKEECQLQGWLTLPLNHLGTLWISIMPLIYPCSDLLGLPFK